MVTGRLPMRATLLTATVLVAACGRAASDPAPDPPPPPPRALTDVVFERTETRRARGEYLATGILQCFVCHSERDWTQPGAPPVAGREGVGAAWWDKPWLVAPNLTPDEETGIGRRTDDMIARAVREGISHDGRRLHPQMWSASFSGLTDEDLASVVVYLRSRPAVRHPLPATVLPEDIASDPSPPPTLPPAPPDLSTPLARGRYLVGLADCSGCHTSWYTPRNPGLYGGGNLVKRAGQQAYGSNLTSDPSGLSYYDAALFREVMRTGRLKGRTLSAIMPTTAFRHLSDEDLDAIFAYLSAHRPAKHVIDNVNPETACAICGGTHPLGEYNRPAEVRRVAYDIGQFRDAAGRYRLYPSWTLEIEVRGRRLFLADEDGGDGCELQTSDGRLFVCDGGIDEIEFVRDAERRVTSLLVNGVDPAVRVGSRR